MRIHSHTENLTSKMKDTNYNMEQTLSVNSRLRMVHALLLLLVFLHPIVCSAGNGKYAPCEDIDVGEDTCLVDLAETGPIKVIVHGTKNDPFWQQVEAGMRQTADDMKIDLDMVLFDDENPLLVHSSPTLAMVSELKRYVGYYNGADSGDSLPRLPAAMIVSMPGDAQIQAEIENLQQSKIPIFGINAVGNSYDGLLQGSVSMNETHAGALAGNEINDLLLSKDENTDGSGITGIYVNHQSEVDTLTDRFDALSAATEGYVESWEVVHTDSSTTEKDFMTFFEGCKHTVVQLAGGSGTVDAVLNALVANGCNIEDDHIVGTFDTSTFLIYDAMNEGSVKFAISQQPYLQGSSVVLMADLYATTGQKLHSSNLNTGPILITPDNENFPTKEQQSCEIEGFPVCSSGGAVNSNSKCPCTDRSQISIEVITHDESSEFWGTVFSGISQAATDFGVSVKKNQFKRVAPQNMRIRQHGEPQFPRLKHTFDINEACQSKDIDGLIVSLPDATMIDALAPCYVNGIPYLAINAAAQFGSGSKSSLFQGSMIPYVGQKDFESGLEAGKRLIEAGVTKGWCLVHANFDTINERCRGMEMAFSDANVNFVGTINVPGNGDILLYKKTVEEEIGKHVGQNDWSGIGLLSTGKGQIPALLSFVDDHPEILAGTYDSDSSLYKSSDGTLRDQIVFGIDQNAYMEGYLSVATMVWRILTSEVSTTEILETGPNFISGSDFASTDSHGCSNKDIKYCGAEMPESTSSSTNEYVAQPLKLSGRCKELGRKCNVCEGDCDDDTDCGEGLVCFIRDSKTKGQTEQPPGCSTNPSEWTAKDFCVDARVYECKDEEWISVNVGTFSMQRTCSYVKDDIRRCAEFGRFCRETCGYCRSSKDENRSTNY